MRCHRLPLSHSPTPSPALARVLSAPSQSHFEVLTWKKTTCYFFFFFFFFGGNNLCWGELWSVEGRVRGTLKELQERGRAMGQKAGQQGWLRLPRSCSLPLQARVFWCSDSCCWDCPPYHIAPQTPVLPQLMGKCKGEEESWGKERSEDAVRWEYNQEQVQEREIGVVMEKMFIHGSQEADETGIIRSLANSLEIPLSHSRKCLVCSPVKHCREFWSLFPASEGMM